MREEMRARFEEVVRRAGLRGVPPAVLGAGTAVLLAAVCFGAWRWWPQGGGVSVEAGGVASGVVLTDANPSSTSGSAGTETASAATSTTAEDSARIWVHVVGAVRHPGLYALRAESRVNDAIDAAGGFMGDAAPEGVNLARKLSDGEQLVVPTADELAKAGAGGASTGGAGAGSGAGGATPANTPVDINTATAEQLDALPGIGPATATKIVADRQANGPFKSIDDLGRVAGIGPKKLEDMRALIVVR